MSLISDVNIRNLGGDGDDRVVIFMPGILSRAAEQCRPIMDTLGKDSTVYAVDDAGLMCNVPMYVARVVDLAWAAHEAGQRVSLVGASMGGMRLPLVVEELRRKYNLPYQIDWLRATIIDAPTGAKTFKQLPNWLAWLFLSRQPGQSVNESWFGQMVMRQFPKGLPKPEYISRPPREQTMLTLTGKVMNQQEWNEWVIEQSRLYLSNHLFSMWWSHIAWMIQVERDGSLARACVSLAGVDTTYLICTRGNDVVNQPQAAYWWYSHVPGLMSLDVAASHCGFLQNQPEFFYPLNNYV